MAGYYGAPTFSMETNTEKGIRGLSNALMICIVAAVLSTVASLAALVLVGQISGDITSGFLATAMGVLALLCGVLVLYLVVIIMALIGFASAYKGRMEFGPEHEKDMGRAMIMLVMAVIFFFGGGIISFMFGFYVGISGGTAITESLAYQLMNEIFSVMFAVAVALALYYIVKTFMPPEKHGLAIVAVAFYVLAPVLSFVLGQIFYPSAAFLANPTAVAFDWIWFLPGIISGVITIIALVLFLVIYREVSTRLKSRQFTPSFQLPMMQPQFQGQQFQDQQMRWQPPPPQ